MSAVAPAGTRRLRSRVVYFLAELAIAGGFGIGIGVLVAILASLSDKGRVENPLVLISALSGLCTGVLAVFCGREMLPRLSGFALPVRGFLFVITLSGSAFGATLLGFWFFPWYVAHSVRALLLVGSINALLAVVAGTLVFAYEDLLRRLARTRELLAAERLAQSEARERATRAELRALQARINPHFFFNALNTAVAYVGEDPAYAEQLLEKFAGLFRYAFRRGRERSVELEEELGFIHDYLAIEKARFGERLTFEVDFDAEIREERLPPLILQPLVENAVLHGRDPESGAGVVRVTARRREVGIVLEVRDEGPGPGEAAEHLPRGHALENIGERVRSFRGGWLELGPAPEGCGTSARIVFPFEEEATRATLGRREEQ